MRVRIEVPASSGNVGPGFDVLGLALERTNEVMAELRPGDPVAVEVAGIGVPPELRDPERSLLVRGYLHGCEAAGVAAAARGVLLRSSHRIPVGRGLGSSAAAVLAGLLAVRALHQVAWDDADLVRLGTELEGHPDNVAAALLGGLVICPQDGVPVSVHPVASLRAVVFIPEVGLDTERARAVLPREYGRSDAVHNLGHCALLVHAVSSGQHQLLGVAMRDRLHQPYRAAMMPAMQPVMDAAMAAGARGVALSGAGPAVLALADAETDSIEIAMSEAGSAAGVPGDAVPFQLRRARATADVLE